MHIELYSRPRRTRRGCLAGHRDAREKRSVYTVVPGAVLPWPNEKRRGGTVPVPPRLLPVALSRLSD